MISFSLKQHTPLLISLCLIGCTLNSSGRYEINEDHAPHSPISIDHIQDVTPKYEPYSLGGNNDYTLQGQHYRIIRDAKGFHQQGQASWYGKKFHGHLTSNGEIYDMYSMSAAHKTLPIPSYVRVTNLDNQKTVVVRVNDRGPFHENRIIDLSYSAASKLDILASGVGNVNIEVITPDKPTNEYLLDNLPQYAVQVLSSPYQERVQELADSLSKTLSMTSQVEKKQTQYRLLIGPFDDQIKAWEALDKVKKLAYSTAFVTTL